MTIRLAISPVLLLAAACFLGASLVGCATHRPKVDAVPRGEPIPYPDAARAYSERVASFKQLWARFVVRLNYTDEDGDRHTEQGEGVLQVIRADHLALSIKKAGKMLFWLGCDPERYWWIDVIDERVAQVGRHDHISQSGEAAQRAAGVVIRPLEVIRLLGIIPLDPEGAGSTAWSEDGRFLGITTELESGKQVIWAHPVSYEAQRIELYDKAGHAVLIADLDGYTPADVAGMGGQQPRIAGRIIASHPASGTILKLDLAAVKNQGVAQKAFNLEDLMRTLGVERVIDLDKPVPAPGPGRASANGR